MNPSEAPEGTIAVLETTNQSACSLCPFGNTREIENYCYKEHRCMDIDRKDRCNVYYIPAPKHYVKKEGN